MSFPRYPAYKPSGVEWLGEVPQHWNRTALKFLADYQNGYPFKPEDRGEEGLPIIRISQLTGEDEPAYFSGDLDERVKVRDGDLLFSWSATIDSFIWTKGEAWLNQHIFRVSPSKESDKRFLYYVIKHVAPKLADFDAHGSTMRHIKKESLGERVYVPSVHDQKRIAIFLDRETAKIDALIAEQQRLIELLQEKRQAVISHAVTKGLNPDAPMKDSGVEWLGEVPEHWVVTTIKRIVQIPVTDGPHETPDFVDDGIPFVSAEAVSSGRIDWDKIRGSISWHDHERYSKKYKPRRDDIFMIKSGATTGVSAIVETDREFNIWSPLAAIRCGEEVIPKFALHYIRSRNFQEGVTLAWSFGTQQNIGMGVIQNLALVVPPAPEQEAIIKSLDSHQEAADSLIGEATEAISLLQERRSALISAAVTGQIDVRGLVSEADTA